MSIAPRRITQALLLAALAGRAHAQTMPNMPSTRGMMEWNRELFLYSEVLEYAPAAGERPIQYDLLGWYGGARNRIWAKAEGTQATRSGRSETELQLLYGRLVSPFWDAQMGVHMDVQYGKGGTNSQAALALGVQGLAPGWFELEPTLFLSQRGDVSGKLTASYDVLLSQRLVLQPRLETGFAVQSVPRFGVGSGVNGAEFGLRLRYEIRREFGPYVGISWNRRFGETADLARATGEGAREASWVAGLRLWR